MSNLNWEKANRHDAARRGFPVAGGAPPKPKSRRRRKPPPLKRALTREEAREKFERSQLLRKITKRRGARARRLHQLKLDAERMDEERKTSEQIREETQRNARRSFIKDLKYLKDNIEGMDDEQLQKHRRALSNYSRSTGQPDLVNLMVEAAFSSWEATAPRSSLTE